MTNQPTFGVPVQRFQVAPEQQGTRLDRLLASLMPTVSRTRIQAWIGEGAVRVDGRVPARAGTPVQAGSELVVELRERDIQRHEDPAPHRLAMVHLDEHLAVLDKPAGMLSHPTPTLGGATVSELALRELGPMPSLQGRDRPGIVHRLDAGTSGILVLARTELAFESLQRQFRARTVQKTYAAIVHNEPRFDSDWIDAAIDRNPRAPQKRMVVAAGEGRASSTFYVVRERFRGFARLDCMPKTGRTHQLRVHLTHIGLPIVGDRMYKHHGPLRVPLAAGAPQLARQALHAARIEFDHPATGERVAYEAPLPHDLRTLLDWLRAEHPAV